ncbi:MAG: hypothetical protein DRJ01_04975 [Bacteroidetes bacterium]|nr:MAG: hypothetical protein DRJ01_04975 [Bacteroidota bacterium]
MIIKDGYVEMETPEEAACVWAAWTDGDKENYIQCVPNPEFFLVWKAIKPEIGKPAFSWHEIDIGNGPPDYCTKWRGPTLTNPLALKANALTIGKSTIELNELLFLTIKE